MKHVVIGALLVLAGGTVQAQTAKGRVLLGGGLGYYETNSSLAPIGSSSGNSLRITTGTVAPQVGYFLTNKLVVGPALVLNWQRNETSGYDQLSAYRNTTRRNTLDVGPYARYYQLLGEKFGFFGQLNLMYVRQYGRITSTQPNTYSQSERLRGGYATLQPGFVYFPTSKFGLELLCGYFGYFRSRTQSDSAQPGAPTYTSHNREFRADLNLAALRLGASFYLGR